MSIIFLINIRNKCRSSQSGDDKDFTTIENITDINQYLQERIDEFKVESGCPKIPGSYKVEEEDMPTPSSSPRPGI